MNKLLLCLSLLLTTGAIAADKPAAAGAASPESAMALARVVSRQACAAVEQINQSLPPYVRSTAVVSGQFVSLVPTVLAPEVLVYTAIRNNLTCRDGEIQLRT